MKESLQILVIAASLLIGSISIIFAYRLMRNYKLPYLSTYFYFLVFLFVFSIYGVLGSSLLRFFLMTTGSGSESGQTIQLILIFLGVPFLILSWYMFYRFCKELTGHPLSAKFTPVYFITLALLFLGYGYLLVRILQFGEDLFDLTLRLLVIAYSVITALVVSGGLLQVLIPSRKSADRQFRKTNRLLVYMYAAFYIIQIVVLNFSLAYPLITLLFIFLLFSFHVIPILFLNIFLDKHYVEPEISESFDSLLEGFVSKYGISKRETEIVELIFSGKSNQDISDSLFISVQTVKDHIYRIYLKTGVKNRVQLTNLIRIHGS